MYFIISFKSHLSDKIENNFTSILLRLGEKIRWVKMYTLADFLLPIPSVNIYSDKLILLQQIKILYLLSRNCINENTGIIII